LPGKFIIRYDPGRKLGAAKPITCFAAVTIKRPVGPDFHALRTQGADVGVARQEPQKFAGRRFPIDPFGREEWNLAVRQVKTQAGSENRTGADAGAVHPLVAGSPDPSHQIKVLLLVMHRPMTSVSSLATAIGRRSKWAFAVDSINPQMSACQPG